MQTVTILWASIYELFHWVENGEYPNDEAALKKIVEGVCYRNAARYFNL